MEVTMMQIILMAVVGVLLTILSIMFAGIRRRHLAQTKSVPAPEPRRFLEPERHIRNAQIALAVLSGSTAADIRKQYSGYEEELTVVDTNSKIYTIVRHACKKCATYPVTPTTSMTELRNNKDQFIPLLKKYIEVYGPILSGVRNGN